MNLEQRFFNLSPDLYCVIDIHGFIQQVNPAFEKILGFAAFEVLAQPYLALVHLDDVPATIEALEALKRGISTRYHNRYRCKDGSEKLLEWIAEPVMEEGVEERLIYMVGRDVTAQKRLQEEQERFFAVGADLLSIGTFDGVLTWVSPSWEKTLGWTKEELTAYPWLHFVHPEDHEKTLQAAQELVAGVELISFENRYLCKDGSYRWISWRSRPFPDERLIYGAAVDITERKLAEMSAQEALKESEERYRTFVNTVSSIVWTTNDQGFMVGENPLWEKFTGQTREEYKDWGWLNAIHPDDQAQTREVYQKSLQEQSLYETKYRIKRYDSQYRYVVTRGAAVVTADGNIREWVGTCTDIHDSKLIADALQQSQERLELSLRQSPIILYTCDTELRYTWVGKAHPDFNPQDMLGKRDDEILPLEMVQELMAFKRRVMESGKTGRETLRFEIFGKLNIYDITAEPLYENGDDAALVGLTVTALDVTERQLYEERFRLMANSIPQLAWMASPDGWIFWYNQRWYDYTGTTFSDMEGWGWQSVHHPEELPKILTQWKHSIDAGEAFDMEFPLKAADGTFRWFLTRAYPQKDNHGRVVLWFGTNTDVTEQRKAREEREQLLKALEQEQVRLRAVLDNIPVAVVLAEAPQGKIVMANKQTEEIFRHPVIYSTDYNSYREWESYDANGRRTESHEYPLAKVFATGQPCQNEYHYQRVDLSPCLKARGFTKKFCRIS